MNYYFIINPKSGTGTLRRSVESIIDELKKIGHRVSVNRTRSAGDAVMFSQQIELEIDLVVTVGGDGTVNEVINGMMACRRLFPLAIIPAGTVNDFATHYSLPTQKSKILKYLQHFKVRDVDLGKANGRYFVNVLAAGFVAKVGYSVSKSDKKLLGRIAYYIGGFYTALKNLNRSQLFSVEWNGKIEQYDAYMFIALNSSSLGGLGYFAPDATCEDGLLDVYIIKKTGLLGSVALLTRLLIGQLKSDKHVEYRQLETFRISSDDELISDVDGEMGDDLPLDIRIVPKALKLAVPSKL